MYRVLTCLATQHDYRLVLLAGIICAATAFTSFQTYSRFADTQAAEQSGAHHVRWLFLTGVSTAAGIWGTHFVAMLAYDSGFPTAYDPVLTIASLVVAALVTTVGFSLSAQGSQAKVAAGGAIIGGGIGVMHFTGMQALIVPGTLAWDATLVVASLVIGMMLGSAALVAYHQLEPRKAPWAAAGLLTLAICGMHFTAMGAATIVPDPTVMVGPSVMSNATLAIGVAGITMLVIVAALAMAVLDAQAERALLARNQELVDAALEGLVVAKGGRIVNVNRRILELSGWSSSELLGKSVADDLLAGAVERAPAANLKATEAFLKTACGGQIPIEVVRQHLHGNAQGNEVYAIRDLTERRAAEQVLRRQNEALQQREEELRQQNVRFDLALTNMAQGLCVFDAAQRLVICNEPYLRMYHLTPAQAKPGTTLREILEHRIANGLFAGTDPEEYIHERLAAVADGKAATATHHLSDGRTISVGHQPIPGGGWITTHEDITERHKLFAQLEQNNELLSERTSLLQAVIDNFPGGISFLDGDLHLTLCNERFKRILDFPDWLFANGPPSLEDFFRFNAGRGEYGPGDLEEQVAARMVLARARKPHVFERERADGSVIEVRGVPLDNGGFVTTYTDITERRRSEAKIAHMAHHDALTDLPNRVLLNERLEQVLARVKRGEIVAAHLLDLDQFKNVNDTLGHPAGDKLLKMVTDRLRALVRETDTVARMGGDEFAILQVAIAGPSDATLLAQRVIEVVSEPYEIEGQQIIIGASVGIAMGPGDGLSPDQLMRNADLALYRSKGKGRGTYCFFEPEMDQAVQARCAMEKDLRKALVAGEFELYYQPVVNLARNDISGFEALVRWKHPERGMVPPDVFIPLAEEIGFIVPLGEWALRTACATAAKWPEHIAVSVNLSPVQFRNPQLAKVVAAALAASGLPPERLELEVTETALFHDSETTLSMLYELRELGVRIAMDDFGTGYSSLSYLQSFPFDKIKIDRSFVKDITEAVGSLNIVRAVTALAQGLGMATTAEGVETKQQLDAIKAEGCTEMQGFLFSEALPASEIDTMFLLKCAETSDGNAANAA